MSFQKVSAAYHDAHYELVRAGCSEADVVAYFCDAGNLQRLADDIRARSSELALSGFSAPIEKVGLSNLITSHLCRSKRYRIRTLGDLERLTDSQLRNIPGIGTTSIRKIREVQRLARNSAM